MKDPIIAEVRRVRRKISLMDPQDLAADLESIRERYKHRLVNFPPKRIKPSPSNKPRRDTLSVKPKGSRVGKA